ncbi:FAD-binding oxidoreductase [Escherichia coli]|nr:FAD-binding oxidoreductase [Escherichia coli]
MTITFAVPQPLQEAYRFRPGQHLTLKPALMVKNYAVVTPFAAAICLAKCSVAVKAIEGGRFSRYAREHIRQGMTLEVMVPQGISAISRRPNARAAIWQLQRDQVLHQCWRLSPPLYKPSLKVSSPDLR